MKIGKVVSINYNQIKAKISSGIRGGSVNISGSIYYFGNIGSYLKIHNAVDEVIICEVVSIFDSDANNSNHSFDIESNRELLLTPIGTIDKSDSFSLGVGIFPSLYSDVSIVTHEDMKVILKTNLELFKDNSQNNNESKIHSSFSIGTSKNLINYPIEIGINRLFNIHSAVLGNSGSGKSNTIAHIIQQIHKKSHLSATGSRILIFDVNGEYKSAFSEKQNNSLSVKFYKPNIDKEEDGYQPFFLPHFLLSLDEWSSFLLATEATQRPFWSRVLQESYRFYRIGNSTQEDTNRSINYLRYRICNMIYSILRQADTDTARITTAASVLGSIISIINSDAKILSVAGDLLKDISALQGKCTISYGDNKGALEKEIDSVSKKVDVALANEVLNHHIKSGEYFDYKFLKIASELVLLEEDSRGNKQIRGYTSTMLTRLDYFLENSDCNFMREHNSIRSESDYRCSIWSNESEKKSQLVVIDTSELSPDILETLTCVVARLIFDERKRLIGDKRRKAPVHLVLDEAHRYIKKNYQYLLKENIFEKIAREGRKYSLYLLISSQRPSELSETVLSQCGNFIIHRIQNEVDMRYIQAILPYYSDDFTNKIKQSIPGEALIFGNCVSMPLHISVHRAKPAPNSENCDIPREWFV